MCECVTWLDWALLQVHNQPDVYESEDPEPVSLTSYSDDTTSSTVEQLPSGVRSAYGQFNSRLLDSRFTGMPHEGQCVEYELVCRVVLSHLSLPGPV